MAQYTPITIKAMVSDIERGKIVLPALQRNFVWEEDKISRLFDSLMRGFPIGTFLFWSIDRTTFKQYTFKEFIKNYDEERRGFQRGQNATADLSDYLAVLDGQQRITALYLALSGSWRTHIKYTDWSKSTSYYFRYFCINILQKRTSDDEDYEFAFIKDADIRKPIDNGEKFWVKVSDIIDSRADEYMDQVCQDFEDDFPTAVSNPARRMLRKLDQTVCITDTIHYYSAKDMSLAEVGDIFERVNNGGQKLSYSDLMLSIATREQDGVDLHDLIEEKLTYINSRADEEKGFKADTELILTAGLMFTNAQSLSLKKKENYSPAQMNAIFKDNWDSITEALAAAVEYLEYIGFEGRKLTSKNLILPIAYYFYANNVSITKEKGASSRAVCDFVFIRQWLLRTMINSVFSDAIGNTLIRIRNHISTNNKYFPLDVLMREKIKKPLDVDENQISEILDYKKGDSRVVPLLMELAQETTAKSYDADHIWPQTSLSKSSIKKNYPEITDSDAKDFQYYCDRLPNIEILPPGTNKSKSDTPYAEWIKNCPPNPSYYDSCVIPQGCSYEYKDFLNFIKLRSKMLEDRIKKAFPSTFDEIVSMYSLQNKLS